MTRADLPGRDAFPARRGALLALGLLALASQGCGFKLRGARKFSFETLYAGFAPQSPLGADFRREIRANESVRLVDRPQDAQVRLLVLNELREKEIVGFSSTGRPRVYELRLRFAFRLVDARGVELVPATELLLRRDITTTDAQLVAKEQEEKLLYADMQSELFDRLFRRLAAVRL